MYYCIVNAVHRLSRWRGSSCRAPFKAGTWHICGHDVQYGALGKNWRSGWYRKTNCVFAAPVCYCEPFASLQKTLKRRNKLIRT
ncbi:hypothetical protein [Klebsiella phage vB_KshKPC-M]|nr:hypothetical protein [Klebsiella phage vB_KshKPC-M]